MISGRAGKKIPEGLEDGKIFVGKQSAPVAVILRREIAGYLTPTFWEYYQTWTRFEVGLGLPYGGAWMAYPESFISIIEAFQTEWRSIKNG